MKLDPNKQQHHKALECGCVERLCAEATRLEAEHAKAAASAPSLHHMGRDDVNKYFDAQAYRLAAVWLREHPHNEPNSVTPGREWEIGTAP